MLALTAGGDRGARRGAHSAGKTTRQGEMSMKIYQGSNPIGTPVFNLSGNKVYRGSNPIGTPAYNIV